MVKGISNSGVEVGEVIFEVGRRVRNKRGQGLRETRRKGSVIQSAKEAAIPRKRWKYRGRFRVERKGESYRIMVADSNGRIHSNRMY